MVPSSSLRDGIEQAWQPLNLLRCDLALSDDEKELTSEKSPDSAPNPLEKP